MALDYDYLKNLREKGIQTPVIFLTGENSESKKVSALEMGGDDYIKPFGFPELVARIHAVLRRAGTAHDNNVTANAGVLDSKYQFCGAEIDPQLLQVHFSQWRGGIYWAQRVRIFSYLAKNIQTLY